MVWSEIDDFDRVWVDDQTPAGATLVGDGDGWNWQSDNVFKGQRAHSSALAAGTHQHYFVGAMNTMVVNDSNTLFAMVFLDPDNPPDEVMLQWHTTDWLSRAYWGANIIDWGTDGTPQRHFMGPLPPTGEWVRLEVPAQAVGLTGGAVNVDGMAFTLFGGRATWDYAGKISNATELRNEVRDLAFAIWVGRVRGGGSYFGHALYDWVTARNELGIPPDLFL